MGLFVWFFLDLLGRVQRNPYSREGITILKSRVWGGGMSANDLVEMPS